MLKHRSKFAALYRLAKTKIIFKKKIEESYTNTYKPVYMYLAVQL
jgi:hypothetical protein